MYSRERVAEVLALGEQGLSRSAIARATAVSRATVREWLNGQLPSAAEPSPEPWLIEGFPTETYAYLLGLYLGDGYLARAPRTIMLRISFDARYPKLIGEGVSALRRLRPDGRVHVFRRVPSHCVVVQSAWTRWPLLFPQHGPGPKHRRSIVLAPWQLEITTARPKALVRGLLQSDGCRFINTVRVRGRSYAYPRYLFTNVSEDIKGILCDHLDLLGIAWRRAGARNISIARREAVARLDEFVGPKR